MRVTVVFAVRCDCVLSH